MDPEARLHQLVTESVRRLVAAGARDEALGLQKRGRGIAMLRTADSMVPVARAFRLGVLLLGHDGELWSVGKITRAVAPGRPQGLSASVDQRRADRLAASRGHFVEGEVVHYDWAPIAQDSETLRAGTGPLRLRGDDIVVHWGPASGDLRPLEEYLRDREEVMFLD